MKTYPLESISLKQAQQLQFKLVEAITKEFKGSEFLNLGDLGVVQPNNKPKTTFKVERVLSDFFDVDDCRLVRGAGSSAIRFALQSCVNSGDTILLHDAPIYPTTLSSIEMMGLKYQMIDFNNLEKIRTVFKENPSIKVVLIQYTRQQIIDSYDIAEVISEIKKYSDVPIITDDNYAVLKVKKIGVQLGADLSCFSCFKLLGPEGIGCVVGNKNKIDIINKLNYSGGSQVQGFEAQEVLRGMSSAPVLLATQAEEINKIIKYFKQNNNPNIADVFVANAQSKVILIEFKQEIAAEVLKQAELLGAAANPVGAESKYELVPMFYRVSGTFSQSDPAIVKKMIRINPMRSGADTVVRILLESIERAKNVFK